MKKIFTFLSFLIYAQLSFANNITVTNASISGQNTTTHKQFINFDISWEISWRTSTNESNYDGAWIFVIYRKNSTTDWRHATINSTGNTPASGATFTIPTDRKGAFIYRSADGIGNVSFTANQLTWDYAADGLLDNETVEIKVFALEMVYIPSGTFQLGSGGSEANAFKKGTTTSPYDVTAAAITFANTGTTDLNTTGSGPTTGTLQANYPTGFNAFWIMKYETSQQQYVDFLNHIDLAKANLNNTPAFTISQHPSIIAGAPERAMGNLSSQRLASIADWSGLRPFTELEFEKASRGYNTPAVANEFVWGTTTAVNLAAVTNNGLSNETVSSPANANSIFSFSSPMRVGLFARSTGATRELSGATYYGVMNMGDNVNEICINVATTQGQAFDGTIHGDGYLAATGNTDIANWGIFNAYGWRGGAYNSGGTTPMRTSDRSIANVYTTTYGSDAVVGSAGARMARTAP